MKAPAFWYQPYGKIAKRLAPLGAFYRWAGIIRRGITAPYYPSAPVICIGNVVAGGAGKTPTALAILELTKRLGAKPVFVTRGYGGSESGPLQVDPALHSAAEVGDEALLLADAAPCWVGRNRRAAIELAEEDASLIILDDGLQNPTIGSLLRLLVIDGASGIGNGALIPAGPLRETLADALARIDGVVMIGNDQQQLSQQIRKPIFAAQLVPQPVPNLSPQTPVIAFAGIGRPEKFYQTCREAGLTIITTYDFPDHHPYTDAELGALVQQAAIKQAQLITTSKDWVRLPPRYKVKILQLPVKLQFADEAAVLELLQSVTVALRAPS